LAGGARAHEADEGLAELDDAPVARGAEDAREVPLEVVAIPLHRGPQLVGEPRELGGGVFRLPTLVRFVAQLGHHGLGAALLPEQPRVENADSEPDDQEEDVSPPIAETFADDSTRLQS